MGFQQNRGYGEELDDTKLFPFGRMKVPVKKPEPYKPPPELLEIADVSRIPGVRSQAQSEQDQIKALFSMPENQSETSGTNGVSAGAGSAAGPSSSKQSQNKWDRSYLLNLVGNEDILDAILENLNSERSDDQIQETLFDLLGFDRIELITDLLSNRVSIIREINRQEVVSEFVRNQIRNSNPTQAHPVIGVSVQSAQEKLLEKLYRREDKKAAKSGTTLTPSADVFQAEVQTGDNIRRQIQATRQTQEYQGCRGVGAELPTGIYPNVYDLYAETKKAAGFISGVKMVLPESAKKTQTVDYEEVDIPALKSKPPPQVEKLPLIKISSLDEVAQKVFRGMTTLNRIQSIVYETAYKTNETLLICAPTGAGKTNIALLSVLNCIMSNTEGDVIRKDQFKVTALDYISLAVEKPIALHL